MPTCQPSRARRALTATLTLGLAAATLAVWTGPQTATAAAFKTITHRTARLASITKLSPLWSVPNVGGQLVSAPRGAVYVERPNGVQVYSPNGLVLPGWKKPLTIAANTWTTSPDGYVYEIDSNTYPAKLYAFSNTGQMLRGWPLNLPEMDEIGTTDYQMAAGPGNVLYLCTGDHVYAVTAKATVVPGWPVQDECYDLEVGPDGLVYIAGGLQTQVLKPNGQAVSSPLTSLLVNGGGYESAPLPTFEPDGTVFISGVSVNGAAQAFYSRTGQLLDSWMYEESQTAVAPDGTVYYYSDQGTLAAVDKNWQPIVGWPVSFRPGGPLEVDASPYNMAGLVVSPSDVAYTAVYEPDGTHLVAINRSGHVVTGWDCNLTSYLAKHYPNTFVSDGETPSILINGKTVYVEYGYVLMAFRAAV